MSDSVAVPSDTTASTVPLSHKAQGYIASLNSARYAGKYSEVPELSRKVGKHAPHRKCLATISRCEALQNQRTASHSFPPGVSAILAPDAVDQILLTSGPRLATKEDLFQARAIIAWLHWVDGKWEQAILACAAKDLWMGDGAEKMGMHLASYTHVIMVRAAFVHGASQQAIGKEQEAMVAYKRAIPKILNADASLTNGPEFRLWAERLLNRYCRLLRPAIMSDANQDLPRLEDLRIFRMWSKCYVDDAHTGRVSNGGYAIEQGLSRRTVWLEYYTLTSYHLASASFDSDEGSHYPPRLTLVHEIQRIEKVYENLLLREVAFPQASEHNVEVEEWVARAMRNWAITSTMDEADSYIEGGKRALSRRMLDMLYRAATRSFHSMSILRSLSAVHTALADFDLARRALESYITIATKAKARTQNSGESEPGVDTDDQFLEVVASGIQMLCTFGKRNEANKALDLASMLRQMLVRNDPTTRSRAGSKARKEMAAYNLIKLDVSGRSLGIGHRAMGTACARWAQLTFEPAQRLELQNLALQHFRDALSTNAFSEGDTETRFALSLLLAETRDIDGAILTIKKALSQNLAREDVSPVPLDSLSHPSKTIQEFVSLKCWHLLSLLLTTRQDFDTALTTCDTALQQSPEKLHKLQPDGFERPASNDFSTARNTIEARITRMAILEIAEGPEVAVNGADQLLGLYTKLFNFKTREPTKAPNHLASPSTTSLGRSSSLRHSIFGRNKLDQSMTPSSSSGTTERPRRYSADFTRPPALENPDGSNPMPPSTSHSRHHRLFQHDSKRLQKRPSKRSLNRPQTAHSTRVTSGATTDSNGSKVTVDNVNKSAISAGAQHLVPPISEIAVEDGVGLAVSSDDHVDPGVDSITDAAVHTDHRSSIATFSSVHYPDAAYRRCSLSTLTLIWLFIGGLYRRSNLFDDASSAIQEAFKNVCAVEALVATDESSSRAFEESGWSGIKSVEEMYADAYAEKGQLQAAQGKPHDAMMQFENALTHFPDHPVATVALANILLDVYAQKIPPGLSFRSTVPHIAKSSSCSQPVFSAPLLAIIPGSKNAVRAIGQAEDEAGDTAINTRDIGERDEASNRWEKKRNSPEALDRLAARDRAYALLSTLTKLGTGWDDSEAWFTLAKVHEESGELDKAQDALWWVVELENKRPIRHWSCLGQGYSLRF